MAQLLELNNQSDADAQPLAPKIDPFSYLGYVLPYVRAAERLIQFHFFFLVINLH